MAAGGALIAGGALLLLALGKRKPSTSDRPVCPAGTALDASGRCVAVTSTQPQQSNTTAQTIGSAIGTVATTVTGFITKAGVGGGSSAAATEAVASSAVASSVSAGGFIAAGFIIVMYIILFACLIADTNRDSSRAWARQRAIRGGGRYFAMVLGGEQIQFRDTIERLNYQRIAQRLPQFVYTQEYFTTSMADSLGLQAGFAEGYYFITSLDPGVPRAPLAAARAFSRYTGWLRAQEMNRVIYAYYGTRPEGDILPGTPQSSESGPGGLTPGGRAMFSMEPGALNEVLEQQFAALPASFTAGIPVPSTLGALRPLALQVLNDVAGRPAQVDGQSFVIPSFADFEYMMKVMGAMAGAAQCASVGFSQLWPGDAAFALGIWNRTGLAAAGWPPPRQMDIPGSPGSGGGSNGWSWFIVEPTMRWALDVKTSAHLNKPVIMRVPGRLAPNQLAGFGRVA